VGRYPLIQRRTPHTPLKIKDNPNYFWTGVLKTRLLLVPILECAVPICLPVLEPAARKTAMSKRQGQHSMSSCGSQRLAPRVGQTLRSSRLTWQRLNPFDTRWVPWISRGLHCFTARRYEEAIAALRQVGDPINEVRGWLAASYAHGGRLETSMISLMRCARRGCRSDGYAPLPTLPTSLPRF
jgi:hypothetical protein